MSLAITFRDEIHSFLGRLSVFWQEMLGTWPWVAVYQYNFERLPPLQTNPGFSSIRSLMLYHKPNSCGQ